MALPFEHKALPDAQPRNPWQGMFSGRLAGSCGFGLIIEWKQGTTTCLPACLPAYLPAYLPTCLPTYCEEFGALLKLWLGLLPFGVQATAATRQGVRKWGPCCSITSVKVLVSCSILFRKCSLSWSESNQNLPLKPLLRKPRVDAMGQAPVPLGMKEDRIRFQ